MKLLAKSVFHHMKNHLLQTVLTLAVVTLVTGLVAVIFNFAASIQHSFRSRGLETGSWHICYYVDKDGSEWEEVSEGLLRKMEEEFRRDSWFSKVEFKEDNDKYRLYLTVKHPNFFTSFTMDKKEEAIEQIYDETIDRDYWAKHGQRCLYMKGIERNYELLVSHGDLSKESGVLSYMILFFLLLVFVAAMSVLTTGAVFQISAMQRDHEFALLATTGANQVQLAAMVLLEGVFYGIISLPAGFFLGMFVYGRIQKYLNRICHLLLGFSPSKTVFSTFWNTAFICCMIAVILLSGLKSAIKAAHTSPIEMLRHTKEIYIPKREKNTGNLYRNKRAVFVHQWLAKKSYHRSRRKNRTVFAILSLTFILCLISDGIRRYGTEIVKMSLDELEYNYEVTLSGDKKEEVEDTAKELAGVLDGEFVPVKEAGFALRPPFPATTVGLQVLRMGNYPNADLVCVDEKSFRDVCRKAGVSENREGLWGIFLDMEKTWYYNEMTIRGKPYELAVNDSIELFSELRVGSSGEEDTEAGRQDSDAPAAVLEIAGVCGQAPRYVKNPSIYDLQILVPERVFSELEGKQLENILLKEDGAYRILLRGNIENADAAEKTIRKTLEHRPGIVWHTADYMERIQTVKDGVDSFEFLCAALIGIFVFICICSNFTISWAGNRAREQEFAILLSVGMTPENLQKMRFIELFYVLATAFISGTLCGGICYYLIYKACRKEYMLQWYFPWEGLLLGVLTLVISIGMTEAALAVKNKRPVLAERLKVEE